MLETIQQGFLGLFLFFGQMMAPSQDVPRIAVESVSPATAVGSLRVRCRMEITLSAQFEQLIDAGIPLRLRMSAVTDRSDTVSFVRYLLCDVVSYTYTLADSAGAIVIRSQPYPMILLALRDMGRWETMIPADAQMCRIEVTMLPSRVSQLGRTLDMSRLWGQERVTFLFDPREKRGVR